MAAPDVLEITGLCKEYDGCPALCDLSLRLKQGDFLALLGPNGAGKSTLLRIIATLASPDRGRVAVYGADLAEEPERFRRRLGFISHHALLYDHMSAQENLVFSASLYGVADPPARAEELLRRVGLHHQRHRRAATFSRGMRQRLSIARALVNDPDLLLLDEPFTGLDRQAASLLGEQLLLLKERQRTIIMVTHDMERGLAMASRVGILARGRLVFLEQRQRIDPATFGELYHAATSGDRVS